MKEKNAQNKQTLRYWGFIKEPAVFIKLKKQAIVFCEQDNREQPKDK